MSLTFVTVNLQGKSIIESVSPILQGMHSLSALSFVCLFVCLSVCLFSVCPQSMYIYILRNTWNITRNIMMLYHVFSFGGRGTGCAEVR